MPLDSPHSPFGLRNVLANGLSLVRARPALFVGAAVVCALPALVDAHVESALHLGTLSLDRGELIAFSVIQFVIGCALRGVLFALGADVAASTRRGLRESGGVHVRRTLARIVPLTGVTAIVTLCVLLGSFFLVLPGLFVKVILVFAAASCVCERLDVLTALERSVALTKGNRLRLFALMCIVYLPVLALAALYFWRAFRVVARAPDPNMTTAMLAAALRAPMADPAYVYAANVLVALVGSACFGAAYAHVVGVGAPSDIETHAETFT